MGKRLSAKQKAHMKVLHTYRRHKHAGAPSPTVASSSSASSSSIPSLDVQSLRKTLNQENRALRVAKLQVAVMHALLYQMRWQNQALLRECARLKAESRTGVGEQVKVEAEEFVLPAFGSS